MTDRLPTIERHMFKGFKDNPECTFVEPGPGRQCREPKNHEVHTPNGTTRESWLQSKLQAANLRPRDAGRAILALTVANYSDTDHALVVEALHELLDEVDYWKTAWAHETVDKDHKVREAIARSESCEHHGEEIKQLGEQLTHFDQSYRHAEDGRVALLNYLFEMDRFIDAWDIKAALGSNNTVTAAKLVEEMRKFVARAHRGHERAWKR